ncbi:MAG: hypothetical protein IJ617_02900 [Oscillospiraceae bacterium]|nr:hypothetical protein [Oscillospiraceae bacterium]
MRIETLTFEEALARGRALPWALVRGLSTVSLGPVPAELPPEEELIELRFFSEQEEIRVFRREDVLCAARMTEEEGADLLDSEMKPENRRFGKKMLLRQTVDYDEDGQARLSSPRLCGWEGGGGHGDE